MMKCPQCQATPSTVLDSRFNAAADQVRRRRKCLKCDHRWSTIEVAVGSLTLESEMSKARAELCGLRDVLNRLFPADPTTPPAEPLAVPVIRSEEELFR